MVSFVAYGPFRTKESACIFLFWAQWMGVLQIWAGKCDVKFYPGDDPDAPLIDRKGYDKLMEV